MNTFTIVKALLLFTAAMIGGIAALVSIIAYFAGGPEAVAQTWTFVINVPPAVVNVAVASNGAFDKVEELVEAIERLVAIGEALCRSTSGCNIP